MTALAAGNDREVKLDKVKEVDTTAVMGDDSVSPFLAYEGGFRWPDLYNEMSEMLDSCLLLYPLVAAPSESKINRMPMTQPDAMCHIVNSKEKLMSDPDQKEFWEEIYQAAQERRLEVSQPEEDGEEKKADDAGVLGSSSIRIVAISHNPNTQLAYMIQVNETWKRVTLCFRGSSSVDTNSAEVYMTTMRNPAKDGRNDQDDDIRVHHEFYKYLFKHSSEETTEPNEEGGRLTGYQEILQFHVLPLLRQYQGYKVSGGVLLE